MNCVIMKDGAVYWTSRKDAVRLVSKGDAKFYSKKINERRRNRRKLVALLGVQDMKEKGPLL